jgi:hypothetical protein
MAQERAQRAYIWGMSDAHDHGPLCRLHRRHEEVVHAALNDPGMAADIEKGLKKVIQIPGSIRLVHSCTHFTNCYGLNRFLTLLIAGYVEKTTGTAMLIPQRRIMALAGSNGHRCQGVADGGPGQCHGASHAVTLCEHPDCRSAAGPQAETLHGINVLVIRHGVDQTPVQSRLSAPSSRQLLPYDLPGG